MVLGTYKRSSYDSISPNHHGRCARRRDFFQTLRDKPVLLSTSPAAEALPTQYAGLRTLQEEFSEHPSHLAFPCNQFGAQEPGSDAEILEFATTKYQANFPIFSKSTLTAVNLANYMHF